MEVWSVKVPEEVKDRLKEMSEGFNNNQDFIQALIHLYEMNQLKENGSILSTEVDEIQKLANRIVNVFIHTNDKVATLLENKDKLLQDELVSKERTIKFLQEKIQEQEYKYNDIAGINDSLTESNQEYMQEQEELTKAKLMAENLVSEYKEKNDMLSGLLKDYKEDREQNKVLKTENEQLAAKVQHLEIDNANKVKEIEMLNSKINEEIENYKASIQELKDNHKVSIQELKDRHKDEIEHIKKEIMVEHNIEVLKLQREQQDKISSLTENYNKEVENTHNKNVIAIEQYQSKYKELLEQLEEKQEVIRKLETEKLSVKKKATSTKSKTAKSVE